MLDPFLIEKIIEIALQEDIGFNDITTNSIFSEEISSGVLIAKKPGVIAGLPVAKQVWKKLDDNINFEALVSDGQKVESGEKIALVEGKIRSLLTGERVALNFLQRLSGIATLTSRYVEKVKNYKAIIVDTRKTTPGLRILEKYAITQGGGRNHRLRLDNAVMIKDNHIAGCGSIAEAVERVRKKTPFTITIEVETKNLEEVEEALRAGAGIIMLDNMEPETMKKAVEIIKGSALVEASGGVTLENVQEVAETGVDFISVGELTHSPKALDISFNLF
ncbi:MAG: hypothetical protein PWQ96_915 [Clostridia bacterium]|nr:hypothetical protein [Clostridia bacterium]